MARSLRSLYGVWLTRCARFMVRHSSAICYKATAGSELSAIKRVKRAGHRTNVVSEPFAINGVPTVPSAPLYYQKEEVSHGY